jgi:DNA (cytosine-5)-methyltransferase 1
MLDIVEYPPVVAEYFAGIGLARMGMEQAGFSVRWSNDMSEKKLRMYRGNFGDSSEHRFELGDVATIPTTELPQSVDVAWASFPCTDLSLAGSRGGLHSGASSAYWGFIRSIASLGSRRPRLIALENVSGLATSRAGKDLKAAIRALNGLGYSVDVVALDAKQFLPQSRSRLFLVAAQGEFSPVEFVPSRLRPAALQTLYSDPALRMHQYTLPEPPAVLKSGFSEVAERIASDDPQWWDSSRRAAFLDSMSVSQSVRLGRLVSGNTVVYRTAYRRMRDGVPRWEMRPDDIAGCLRTAGGGSSRQAVVAAGNGDVQVRWMTPVEYAKLMGAENYVLQGLTPNEAYSGFGDAVCVPVVRWLAEHYLMPLLRSSDQLFK